MGWRQRSRTEYRHPLSQPSRSPRVGVLRGPPPRHEAARLSAAPERSLRLQPLLDPAVGVHDRRRMGQNQEVESPTVGSVVKLSPRRRTALQILDLGIHASKPTGKLVLTVLGGIAEFEREIMLERQREGIAKAKAAGKYKGRKPTARAKADWVVALKVQGGGPTAIAKQVGIGRSSVYRFLGDAN
jgi:DNA invertase Pin-like site-specific DNA recombinase